MNPNELDKTGTGNINHWYEDKENKDEKDENSGKLKKNPLNAGNDDDDVSEGHKRTKQDFWEGAGEVGERKGKTWVVTSDVIIMSNGMQWFCCRYLLQFFCSLG